MAGTTISAAVDGTQVISGASAGITAAGQGGFRVTGGNSATVTAFYIANVYQDLATFAGSSGTLLSAYTTQAGKTFALYSNDGFSTVIPQLNGSSAAYQPSGTITTYSGTLDSLTPSSANYTVGATFTISTGSGQVVLFGRANSAAATYYQFVCQQGGGNCAIFATVSGSSTQVGSTYVPSWSVGGTHTMSLTMNGTSISGAFDGTTVISGTNSGISAAGQAGFRVTGGSSAKATNFYVQ